MAGNRPNKYTLKVSPGRTSCIPRGIHANALTVYRPNILLLLKWRLATKRGTPPPKMTLPCTYRSKALRLKISESITQATTGVVQFAKPL